jgi:hypothetical protein
MGIPTLNKSAGDPCIPRHSILECGFHCANSGSVCTQLRTIYETVLSVVIGWLSVVDIDHATSHKRVLLQLCDADLGRVDAVG